MRKAIIPIILAVIVLSTAGYFAYQTFTERPRQVQKIEIPESCLETSDTSRYRVQPIFLERHFSDDSILVFFPEKSKKSQLFMYDQSNYSRLVYGDRKGIPMVSQAEAASYKALFGRPAINLSGRPEGKYYVHVTHCNFGGFIEIVLADKTKADSTP
jgi:hypothetical protein